MAQAFAILGGPVEESIAIATLQEPSTSSQYRAQTEHAEFLSRQSNRSKLRAAAHPTAARSVELAKMSFVHQFWGVRNVWLELHSLNNVMINVNARRNFGQHEALF